MNSNNPSADFMESGAVRQKDAGVQINFKRIADRTIRLWYIPILSLCIALAAAYLVNRYSTRIYPVKASIIIKESEENAGAKFLYDNSLLKPYRNFFNEIYIMRSYPLMQGVMEDLGFDVSFYREGEIKTTEYYDKNFPIRIDVVSDQRPGQLFFVVRDSATFTLQRESEDRVENDNRYNNLHFNDTIKIGGALVVVQRRGDINDLKGKAFTVKFNNPLALAKSYSSRLSAGWAQQGASVVNLEINGPVAQKEVDFLNKFIERYQQYDIENKNKMATMAIRFLDNQLKVIGDSLKFYEDRVEDFKHRNIITTLDAETNRLYMRLKELEGQKFDYRLLENYYKYVSNLLQTEQYEGIFTPSSVGITDNVVAGLVTQLLEEQTKVNLYKRRSSVMQKMDDNPLLQSSLQKIDFLKRDILKTIENSKKTNVINIAFIGDQIKLVQGELAKLPRTERELTTIERNYSLKENLFIYLLQKRTEAGLSRASTTSDIVVVNPPMAGGPISPKVSQNYGLAGGVGLLLPLLVFVLLEVLNNRIQSKDDIEKLTSVPVTGAVGHNLEVDQLVVINKSRSAMAEAFRALRSNLNYFTGNKDHQVFMVTSSLPGEGKSFTTLNLASVFAMAGRKTIIVGADLRKPKLFDQLGRNNASGLSQYLSGMAELKDVIQPCDVENLYLISGGPMPPNPSELLLRPAMTVMINTLREQFDYVIIDTPPLSFVTDAFVLSNYADHTLFVVRQDYTPKQALLSLDEFYNAGKLANISVLFNDIRKTGLGYGYGNHAYGYGYSYGYGYTSDKKNKNGSGYYE